MTTKSISSALIACLFASVATAQTSTAGPRWSGLAGCWQQVAADGAELPMTSGTVCVVPSGATGADLVSVASGKVTDRTHIDADGFHHDVTRQGCAGWESAAWSSDGRRLYLDSDQKCDGLQRVSSGIFALGTGGDWTNVVNVNAGGGHALRVIRYKPVSVDSTYPGEIASALPGRDMAMGAARVAAETRVTVDNVIEANRFLNPAVVQAWLASSGEAFRLDAKTLVRLADAGVPSETIDVMIAVSNPKVFGVMPNASGVVATAAPPVRTQPVRQDCYSPSMDPWGYSDYRSCEPYSRRYGFGYGSPFYDPFDYLYGPSYYGYGYGAGFGGFGYGYGGTPVVVFVQGTTTPQTPHGRMTKGGYVSGGTTTTTANPGATRSEAPAPASDGCTTCRSSGSSGGSSSGGSSSSGGGSSSAGRTAQRKPPAV